eukprot:7648799-Ditylum_brightwellii.AAC.1
MGYSVNFIARVSRITLPDGSEIIIVVDCGATVHMFNLKSVFRTLSRPPTKAVALLGDGITSLDVEGIGEA